MSVLLEAAQRAYATTRIYREIYGRSPTVERDVPFISHVAYHRARGLLDCITDSGLISGALPPYHRNVRRLPLTVVESEREWDQRLARLTTALVNLGAWPGHGTGHFVLVAEDATGTLASYLSEVLSWERQQASIVYADGGCRSLALDLSAYDPEVVLLLAPSLTPDDLPAECGRIVSIEPIDRPLRWLGRPDVDTILMCDESHVIAWRSSGAPRFDLEAPGLLVEAEPRSGQLCITTLDFDLFPLIRYALGAQIEMITSRPSSDG